MIEILPESGGNLLAMMVHGEVTHEDYTEMLIPRLEKIIDQHGKARLLYAFADDFTGFTLGAMWDDGAFGLTHLSSFEKVAVVTGVGWIRGAVTMFGPFMSGPVRLFPADDLESARSWISGQAD
jgi:SpoIIAA-like